MLVEVFISSQFYLLFWPGVDPEVFDLESNGPILRTPVLHASMFSNACTEILSFVFSHSGKFLLFGMDDGVLRIHPLDGSNDFENFSNFWALNVHDNHHGGIRHIKTSFDDKYVFTAGMDGNFFVFRFMDKAVKGLKVSHKVSIPSAKVR